MQKCTIFIPFQMVYPIWIQLVQLKVNGLFSVFWWEFRKVEKKNSFTYILKFNNIFKNEFIIILILIIY